MGPSIAAAIRDRIAVSDQMFDRLYPGRHRRRSREHWTPVEVAVRAAWMLADVPGGRVLDVGSGTGKACLIGALSTNVSWTGVERDEKMVAIARDVARTLGADVRASFIHGDAFSLDWTEFGGIYLFNPFSETLYDRGQKDPVLRHAAFVHAVLQVEEKLAMLRPGTHVVTLHGFGGNMPRAFVLAEEISIHGDALCHWVLGR
jgi:SAM-dependent methyltransferase